MKSWADEQDDSSDDDSPIIPPSGFPGGNDKIINNNVVKAVGEQENNYQIPPKEFILPNQPPYTAYVGNLPNDIRSSNDLGREVEALLSQRQCTLARRLNDARLMMEKGSNASRGYGYVEFETDGELIEFLHLPNPQLCGRIIKVDVANAAAPRTSSVRGGGENERGGGGGRESSSKGSDGRDGGGRGRQYSDRSDSGVGGGSGRVDGSQFMGGRYAGEGRSNSGNNLSASGSGGGKTTPTAVMRRADSSASQGSRGVEDAAPATDAATKQRPSLKLLARTKPLDNASSTATTQSSIFGRAKPRDETKFVAAATAEATVETKTVAANDTSKDLTSGVAKMEITKSHVTAPASDHAVGNSKSIDNNGSKGMEASAPEKDDNTAEPSKHNIERKDSRGGGGRGGGGRGRGGDKNRENGDRKREGRRDSTRRPSRGVRVGGGRGRAGSEGRGEGRNTTSESRNSKSAKNGSGTTSGKSNAGSGKGKSAGVSSLAAAAAAGEVNPNSLPTMLTTNETKKGPPKKVNSFAAFMDDSDSD